MQLARYIVETGATVRSTAAKIQSFKVNGT